MTNEFRNFCFHFSDSFSWKIKMIVDLPLSLTFSLKITVPKLPHSKTVQHSLESLPVFVGFNFISAVL